MEQFSVNEIISRHGKQRENLMPILQEIVSCQQFLTDRDMVHVANCLQISAAEVYGTASFYSFLPVQKRGKYVIRLCKSIIAKMKGSDEVLNAISEQLGIKPGETTNDGIFSLELVNDIGWSDQEPAMMINDKVYTCLSPEKVSKIISVYLESSHNTITEYNYINN
jgi:NADH:ubiquinone oxidoreductase subunit E